MMASNCCAGYVNAPWPTTTKPTAIRQLLMLAAIGAAIGACNARPEGAPLILRTIDVASSAPTLSGDAHAEAAATVEHQHPDDARLIGPGPGRNEASPEFWLSEAQATLRAHLRRQPNVGRAKNVIFFMGDGMSLATVTAARMYLGQKNGHSGEEARLKFEEFPHVGLSKTYCVNKQTADSACSATAYLCGIKGNFETIGVTGAVQRDNCSASLLPENRVASILAWAQAAGRRTGVVTTTRITHASPTGAYGHTANRNWESDADLPDEAKSCEDIAAQLVRGPTGRRLNVVMGGGRRNFLPANWTDDDGTMGVRLDGVNLIDEWKTKHTANGGRFVRNRDEMMALLRHDTDDSYEDVLGLFNADHMDYYLDADHAREPTLEEMVEVAIERLRRGSEAARGYFLFVEGGRIDHAHHENRARKALEETVQFSDAIRLATELTNAEDTLIVVTADHAHTMSISGYSQRGSDILGLSGDNRTEDALRYTTLAYGTGPRLAIEANGTRAVLDADDFASKDYVYPALVPMKSAAHGGDDVGVFALGPWSHLFGGVYEQNVIPHLIAYASCLGGGHTMCDDENFVKD